jgi:gluconokinase
MKTPCDDYVETKGVIFFARLLEKIRLKDQGLLPADYNVAGCGVWDCFDARFCRFFGVDENELIARTRAGGTNEEILDWCFAQDGRPNEEKIEYWNSFISKRGWRDESSEELEEVKRAQGLGDRTDVQTWVDFHDVDEGRTPRSKFRPSGAKTES